MSSIADNPGPVVRVRPEAIRMARALVRSARRDGEKIDPVVEKIAQADRGEQTR